MPSTVASAARSPRRRPPSWWYLPLAFGLGAATTLAVLVVAGALTGTDDGPSVIEKVEPLSSDADPRELAQHVMESTVHVTVETVDGTRYGSGLLFRDDGHILTTSDLVADAVAVTATIRTGDTLGAVVVGSDRDTDLAVLKIEGTDLPSATLGSAADLTEGEQVIGVGAPETTAGAMTVTEGVIRATSVRLDTTSGQLLGMVVSASTTPLPWGSTIVDQQGAVVALVTGRDGTPTPDPGVLGSYGMPIEYARRVADELVSTGQVRHAWLGAVTDPEATAAVVTSVVDASPAASADLRPGDRLATIEGRSIASADGLALALREHRPGDRITLTVERDGTMVEVEVELAAAGR
jgi:S1-C subfamily serine protease